MRTRSAIGLLGYALAAGLILVLLATALKPIRSDFVSYYAAGTVMRSDSGRLYDRQLQSDTQARLGAKVYLPFVYPPTVALIFVPFSSLDFATAYAVWLGVNLSLLVFCLWLLIRRLGLSESQSEGLQALVLVFLPVYVALVQGQLSVVMLLLFALFFFDDSKRAGIWAGLLLMKPVLAIVPFLILLLNRNRKGLVIGLGVGCAQVLASVGLVGFLGIRDNLALVKYMTEAPNILMWLPYHHNLRQFAWFIGLGNVGYLVLATVAVLAFSAAWLVRGSTDRTKIMAVFLACLVSPHLYLHDLTILLIALSLAIRISGPKLTLAKQGLFVLCGLCSLVAIYPYPIVSGLMLMLLAFGVFQSVRSVVNTERSIRAVPSQ